MVQVTPQPSFTPSAWNTFFLQASVTLLRFSGFADRWGAASPSSSSLPAASEAPSVPFLAFFWLFDAHPFPVPVHPFPLCLFIPQIGFLWLCFRENSTCGCHIETITFQIPCRWTESGSLHEKRGDYGCRNRTSGFIGNLALIPDFLRDNHRSKRGFHGLYISLCNGTFPPLKENNLQS